MPAGPIGDWQVARTADAIVVAGRMPDGQLRVGASDRSWSWDAPCGLEPLTSLSLATLPDGRVWAGAVRYGQGYACDLATGHALAVIPEHTSEVRLIGGPGGPTALWATAAGWSMGTWDRAQWRPTVHGGYAVTRPRRAPIRAFAAEFRGTELCIAVLDEALAYGCAGPR